MVFPPGLEQSRAQDLSRPRPREHQKASANAFGSSTTFGSAPDFSRYSAPAFARNPESEFSAHSATKFGRNSTQAGKSESNYLNPKNGTARLFSSLDCQPCLRNIFTVSSSGSGSSSSSPYSNPGSPGSWPGSCPASPHYERLYQRLGDWLFFIHKASKKYQTPATLKFTYCSSRQQAYESWRSRESDRDLVPRFSGMSLGDLMKVVHQQMIIFKWWQFFIFFRWPWWKRWTGWIWQMTKPWTFQRKVDQQLG